jgi:hypothetical protein
VSQKQQPSQRPPLPRPVGPESEVRKGKQMQAIKAETPHRVRDFTAEELAEFHEWLESDMRQARSSSAYGAAQEAE